MIAGALMFELAECEAASELVTTKRQWAECDNGTLVRHFFDV